MSGKRPKLGGTFTSISLIRPVLAPVDEAIPLPPDDEPTTVNAGPVATWADLTGHEVNVREQQQIAELIRRADRASGGYGAYWLVRTMVTASMHPDVAITLSYSICLSSPVMLNTELVHHPSKFEG